MKKFLFVFVFALLFIKVNAQLTWSSNIAPVIYGKCSHCHNSNGIAPLALMSYADAFQNSSDIKHDITTKKMPPWPPDPSYSHLAHERILTQQEINDIASWVDNGAPRGDSTNEPTPPVFSYHDEIANPDLVVHAPTYAVNTTNDDYHCFVIPTNLQTDQYLTALEAVPGNPAVVHHILIFSDTTNVPDSLDNADPGLGYTSFSGTGSQASKLIGIWVPGQTPYYAPNGMGIRLPAHTKIVLQIHYPGGISGQTDSTRVLFRLTSQPRREINITEFLEHNHLDNGPLVIPANTIMTFYAHYVVPNDLSVLGVVPHMHLIGKSIRSYGVTPANDTIPFEYIPQWDFHWQGLYSFPNVLKIPASTVLYSEAVYDNTTANDDNPNSPPQTVQLGPATTDEMMLVYFAYTDYQPGDENIIIDSTQLINNVQEFKTTLVKTPQLYDPIPNPAKDRITFQYFLPSSENINISVIDISGRIINNEIQKSSFGMTTKQIDVHDLTPGIYFLKLDSDGILRTKKFMIE